MSVKEFDKTADAGPQDPSRHLKWRRLPSLEVLVVVAVAAFVVPNVFSGATLFLSITAVTYVVFAMGVNVLLGWTGISSFGQASFLGAGAYTVGLLENHVTNPLLGVLIGTAVAAAMAFLFAVLSNRITGVEFAMLTLIFGQILWLLTFRIPPLGGENGITAVPRGEMFGNNFFNDKYYWYFAISVTGLVLLGLRRVSGSAFGLSMRAVRDDALRAEALGIRVRLVRIASFTLGGAVCGIAGALMAQQQGVVTPDTLNWTVSGEVLVMCLIGGMRSFWGPVVGAVVFTVLNWYLFDHVKAPNFYIGLILLLVVFLLPRGLLSIRSTIATLRGKPVPGAEN